MIILSQVCAGLGGKRIEEGRAKNAFFCIYNLKLKAKILKEMIVKHYTIIAGLLHEIGLRRSVRFKNDSKYNISANNAIDNYHMEHSKSVPYSR